MKLDDYYRVLGVNRGTSLVMLKRAYRARLLSIHPDCNPRDQLASERTREVIEAYRVLSSPQARYEYDCALSDYKRPLSVVSRVLESGVPQSLAKAFITLVVLVLATYLLVTLTLSIIASRTPINGFPVATVYGQMDQHSPPELVEPRISDCMEWYHTQQLQMGLSNKWQVSEAMSRLIRGVSQGTGSKGES